MPKQNLPNKQKRHMEAVCCGSLSDATKIMSIEHDIEYRLAATLMARGASLFIATTAIALFGKENAPEMISAMTNQALITAGPLVEKAINKIKEEEGLS